MKMRIPFRLFLLVLFSFPSPSLAKEFKTYSQEVAFLKLKLDCSIEKVIPTSKSFGALYICTFGKAKTAKWFVSEKSDKGRVQSIGLMWVDWQIDTGYGIRADWKEVEKALELLIGLYVPTRLDDLRKAFWDSKNEDFSTSDFSIYYTCRPGPQKDLRTIVIQEK